MSSAPVGPGKIPRSSWTPEDEQKMISYIRETVQKNLTIEAPTAKAYWTAFLRKYPLPSRAFKKCKDKYKWLKKKYLQHKNWRNNTGQSAEKEVVYAQMMIDCPNYDQLDEILCSKTNLNPPPGVSSELVDLEEIDIGFAETTGESEAEIFTAQSEDAWEKSPELPTKKRKVETKRDKFLSAFNKKEDLKSEELEYKKALLDFEKKKWENQTTVDNLRFNRETEYQDRQFGLEELKVQNNFELEKLKIEKQFELELKLAELKYKK